MGLSAEEKARVVELLAQNTLFAQTDRETLEEVASLVKRVEFGAGEPVFLEEETSNHVYFIASGSLEIVKYDARTRQISRLKLLSPGEQFSEISALTRANHSTSCFAVEPSVLYSLDYQLFLGFLHARPEVAQRIVGILAALNRRLASSDGYVEYYRQSDFAFAPEMPQLLPMETIENFEVLPVRLERDGSLRIAMIDPYNAQFFGLFRRTHPRLTLKVSAIRRKDFERVKKMIQSCYRGNVPQPALPESAPVGEEQETLRDHLKGTAVFSKLPPKIIDQLVPMFQKAAVRQNSVIFEPGAPSEMFYLIQSGTVGMNRTFLDGVSVEVVRLGRNDSFGEISLLTDSTHELRAFALTDCVLYKLPKAVITKLLGTPDFSIPLAKVLAERIQTLNRLIRVRFYSGNLTITSTMLSGVLPLPVILENRILPIETKGNEIIIGMVNPDDANVFSALLNRYLNNYRVNIFAIRQVDFDRVATGLAAKLQLVPTTYQETAERAAVENEQIGTIERLERILWEAVQKRASDVHLEPHERMGMVRFRIDGVLRESSASIKKDEFLTLTNRLKITAKMDIGEHRLPQDGMFETIMNGVRVYGRVSCVPGVFGETSVIRLVIGQQAPRPLRMIAPDRETVSFLKNIVQHRQGVFLITGPTGSGKTSTLYSALRELNSIGRKIITIEDPVEIVVPGTTQISIHEKIGLGFDKVLRYVLRQDPDVILVGEIRDAVSAHFVFEAALTGHLVFSTLHSNSSLDVVPRLGELGVSESLIASGLVGVMAQRLVPAVCSACKTQRPSTPAEADAFRVILGLKTPPRKVSFGAGCDVCQQTGYQERVAIFEYWKNNPTIREVLYRGARVDELTAAVNRGGFRTLSQFGMLMVGNGLTTVEQVRKVLFGFDSEVSAPTAKIKAAA